MSSEAGKMQQTLMPPPPPYQAATSPQASVPQGLFGQHVVYGQPARGYGPFTGYPTNVIVIHQQRPAVVQPTVRPSDYLALSIVSVIFCCPLSICAIMYSCNSKNSADSGDFLRAKSEGHTARGISIAAIVIGIVIIAVISMSR